MTTRVPLEIFSIRWILTESGKSTVSIAKSNKRRIVKPASVILCDHSEVSFFNPFIGYRLIIIRYVAVDVIAAIPSAIGSA